MRYNRILSIVLIGTAVVFALPVNAAAVIQPTISVAGNYCFAIKNDGSLWMWNYDCNDAYETNDIANIVSKKVADDVAATYGIAYITKDKTLYSIEEPYEDAVSSVVTDNVISVAQSNIGYILKNDLTLWEITDYNQETPAMRKVMRNIKDIADGRYHTVILKTDGTAWTQGANAYGQIGNGETDIGYASAKVMDNVRSISAGEAVSFAVTDDDVLYKWGNNYGSYTGANEYTIAEPTIYTNDVKQVFPKVGYNLVLKTNGELWLYGNMATDTHSGVESWVNDRGYLWMAEIDGLPRKVMENVVEISEDMNGTVYGPALILNDKGELILFDLFDNEGMAEIKTYLLSDDIKQPETDEEEGEYHSFLDITENTREYDAVTHLSRAGLIEGVTETEFMPEKDISRAETAAVLMHMTGKANLTGTASFADVDETDWYYNIAAVSQSSGIMNGYEDNTFRGDATVSEYELVALAARALRNEGTAVEPDKYIDMMPGHVPDWAETDIRYAIDHGIISEDEAAGLSDETMSRGDAAVILYRLYELI